MTRQKSRFDEFLEDGNRRRLYERESLAFEAMELVSRLMEQKGVNRAELAKRIGKSKPLVTQLLSGSRNMTMHTLADLVFALDHRVKLEAHPCDQTVQQEERAASLLSVALTTAAARYCKRLPVSGAGSGAWDKLMLGKLRLTCGAGKPLGRPVVVDSATFSLPTEERKELDKEAIVYSQAQVA